MEKGTNQNFKQLIRLIKYIKNTRDHQLKLIPDNKNEHWSLNDYSDSDWAGDENDRKSVSGWIVMLNGEIICWGSRKQSLTSLSSTEVEYIAVRDISKEILFAKTVLEFIGD